MAANKNLCKSGRKTGWKRKEFWCLAKGRKLLALLEDVWHHYSLWIFQMQKKDTKLSNVFSLPTSIAVLAYIDFKSCLQRLRDQRQVIVLGLCQRNIIPKCFGCSVFTCSCITGQCQRMAKTSLSSDFGYSYVIVLVEIKTRSWNFYYFYHRQLCCNGKEENNMLLNIPRIETVRLDSKEWTTLSLDPQIFKLFWGSFTISWYFCEFLLEHLAL